MIDQVFTAGSEWLQVPWWQDQVWPLAWNLLKIMALVLPLMGAIAYLTLWERKLIGWIQIRLGPNRVGPYGLLQPIADGLKLLSKEILTPQAGNRDLFFLGPVLAIVPALVAWSVIPFGPGVALSNINVGLLFVMAVASIEVYGLVIAGWSSNSKYALLGAIRASAQMVSYELAMGFCIVIVMMVSGSMNLSDIVISQNQGWLAKSDMNIFSWNWIPLFPILIVYFISGLAETNRHPFDVVEGESEIVAGHMVEYSGMSYAIFYMAEYANIWLLSILVTLLFLGGWYAPFNIAILNWIPSWIWLGIKSSMMVTIFIWVRATFPRYRYDQIMRLGWKVFLPITLAWFIVIAVWMQTPMTIWK